MAYTALKNRATNVPVTLSHMGGAIKVVVDEQKPAPIDGLFLKLGTVTYTAGEEATVEISNEGTNGHVIIDAVQWVEVK